LADAAAMIGSHRWVEHRLFEMTGAWSATGAHPAVRLHLFEMSHQHAWHAQLWADRLPALDGVDPEALSVPLGPALGPLFEGVWSTGTAPGAADGPEAQRAGAEPGPATDVARLSALYRVVLPRLIATYGRHLATSSVVSDSPTIRALELVLRDETAQWQAGECLLQSLLADPEACHVAAEAQRTLEVLVVTTGVGPGLVP
jgi:hypothetical protein